MAPVSNKVGKLMMVAKVSAHHNQRCSIQLGWGGGWRQGSVVGAQAFSTAVTGSGDFQMVVESSKPDWKVRVEQLKGEKGALKGEKGEKGSWKGKKGALLATPSVRPRIEVPGRFC